MRKIITISVLAFSLVLAGCASLSNGKEDFVTDNLFDPGQFKTGTAKETMILGLFTLRDFEQDLKVQAIKAAKITSVVAVEHQWQPYFFFFVVKHTVVVTGV